MNKQNEIKNVARILYWEEVIKEDGAWDHFVAHVEYRDGTLGYYNHLTHDEWRQMQATEDHNEMEELNTPPFVRVENRNEHNKCDCSIYCDGCGGKETHDPNDENYLICAGDFGVVSAGGDIDDEVVAFVAAHCHAHPDDFGLCSWCKSYYNRITGERLQLSNAQYELTTHPESNASHGVCQVCKDKLFAETKVRKEMK